MIAPLRYLRPDTVAQACELLAAGPGTVVLAGGQSLIPQLRADRAGGVRRLVDIARLAELGRVRVTADGGVGIGAAVRHAHLATDPVVRERCGLLTEAAGRVGDPQVRARGTLGGSLAFGHPRADLLVAALALDARVRLTGADGERTVTVAELAGPAGLRPGEVLTEVLLAAAPPGAGGPRFAYQRFTHRAESWPVVAVAVVGGDHPRVAVCGVGARAVRLPDVEHALRQGASPREAAALVAAGLPPPVAEATASASYRVHLAGVLVRRALAQVA